MTNKKTNKIISTKEITVRKAANLNPHTMHTYMVREFILGLRPRRFLQSHIWKKLHDNRLVHVTESVKTSALFAEANDPRHEEAHVVAGYFYTPSAVRGSSVATTKFKWINQTDLRGVIPHQLVNRTAVKLMQGFEEMRMYFSKDFEIDKESRGLRMEKLAASLPGEIEGAEGERANERKNFLS